MIGNLSRRGTEPLLRQQVGGSLRLGMPSTFFADAVSGYVATAGTPAVVVQAEAAVHGYTTAFWWAAGILALGAIVTRLLFERGHKVAPARAAVAAVPGAD